MPAGYEWTSPRIPLCGGYLCLPRMVFVGGNVPATPVVMGSVLQGLVFLFSFLIALGFGQSIAQAIGTALFASLLLGVAQLRSRLRS